VVRVDADDRRTFALRFRPHSDRSFGNIPLELAWTDALRRDTDVRPSEPVPGLDGVVIQEVTLPETPESYDCVLFRWIPGIELAHRLTPETVSQLGVLSARLHQHAATFHPPPEIPVRTLDTLTRGNERDVLFTHEHPAFLPPSRRAICQTVAQRYQRIVTALYANTAGRRVIHADLHQDNVKIDRSRLRPLDFYEVIWGYPVQDIALTFFDLRYYAKTHQHGYPALRDAFAQGYTSRLPWPEQHAGQIDTLTAGRRLRQANWVLEHETAQFATSPGAARALPDPAAVVPYFERLEAGFLTLLNEYPESGR